MNNPWTKKNPFMSMWLTAANTASGPARSRIRAEASRQTAAAMTEGVNQIAGFWRNALGVAPSPAARKRRRR